jgi:hypothetical protein
MAGGGTCTRKSATTLWQLEKLARSQNKQHKEIEGGPYMSCMKRSWVRNVSFLVSSTPVIM